MLASHQIHNYTQWEQKSPFILIIDSDCFRRQVDRWAVAGGISCFHTVQHSWETSVIRPCARAQEQCVQCDHPWPDWFLPTPVHQGKSTYFWQLKEKWACILALTSRLVIETKSHPVNRTVNTTNQHKA